MALILFKFLEGRPDTALATEIASGTPKARYRLHYFPESGNSYKLALMLALCSQPWEPVWTDYVGGETRTPVWRDASNEMGEVPGTMFVVAGRYLQSEHVETPQSPGRGANPIRTNCRREDAFMSGC